MTSQDVQNSGIGEAEELSLGETLDRVLLNGLAITRRGYACAAIALLDQDAGSLRIRAAAGFADNAAVSQIVLPVDSQAPPVAVVQQGRPIWITQEDNSAAARAFLTQLNGPSDLLALPLFGGQVWAGMHDSDAAQHPDRDEKNCWPEPACLGAIYVGAQQGTMDDERLRWLTRFTDRLGVLIASSMQNDQLISTVHRLQRERQWVESVMKSVADPIVLTNLDHQILLQNRRAEELFSGSQSANEEKRRALEMNDRLFSAYLSSAVISSHEIVGRDLILVDPLEGSDIHFEVISTRALNARGERIGLVSIFRDVTDLRRANDELARNFIKLQQAETEARRERDRLDLILENVGHPVAVCDARGHFILFNARAEHLFQPEGASTPRTARAVRANAVKLTSFISSLASESGTRRQAEFELLDPETEVTLPMEITTAEVTDTKGQVTAFVSILHDLSEIRELERRRVEQQLFESEKLAAIGRLAASIAHEVNNPLEAIKNSLYLLTTSKNSESNARFLEVARQETERVSHIIKQMLGFARRSGEAEWTNVNQVLEETLVLVEKKLKQSGVRIVRELDPQLPLAHARVDQLRQVFLNLILNAQHAIDGPGEIRILTAHYEQALQPSISIQISDTGRGISESDIARIFEPFFSTRTKGTGLGLWVTQDIVRHHGGRIEVTSVEGQNTTFNIILPIDSSTRGADGKPPQPR